MRENVNNRCVDMSGGEVASIRLLQGVACTLKPADGLYLRCELNQISLVQFAKACGIRTVDIQNADDAPLMVKRDDDLASGCAVAGDMAGKGVHVGDALNLVALGGRAAYAAP